MLLRKLCAGILAVKNMVKDDEVGTINVETGIMVSCRCAGC